MADKKNTCAPALGGQCWGCKCVLWGACAASKATVAANPGK